MKMMYEDLTTGLDLMHFELDGLMTQKQYEEWQAYEHDKLEKERSNDTWDYTDEWPIYIGGRH